MEFWEVFRGHINARAPIGGQWLLVMQGGWLLLVVMLKEETAEV